MSDLSNRSIEERCSLSFSFRDTMVCVERWILLLSSLSLAGFVYGLLMWVVALPTLRNYEKSCYKITVLRNDQLHASAVLTRGRSSRYPSNKWPSETQSRDGCYGEEKNPCPRQKSNTDSTIIQPVA
jgi:hypothetical protein